MRDPPHRRFECILPPRPLSHLPAPGSQQPPSLGSTLAAPPFPQVARGRPHPREAGALPPPRPHPGSGNKVRRRREKADTQAPCPLHSAPSPSPGPQGLQPPELEFTRNRPLAATWLSHTLQCHAERGHCAQGHAAGTGTSCPFLGCGGLSPIHPWCHLAPPTFGATPPESFSGTSSAAGI